MPSDVWIRTSSPRLYSLVYWVHSGCSSAPDDAPGAEVADTLVMYAQDEAASLRAFIE